MTSSKNLEAFAERIASYRGITPDKMRANVVAFLERVTPVADELGVRLTLHPDDPPRPLFGLPRIASTAADYKALFDAVPSAANGICLCVGSLGSRPDNDVVAMAREFGPRIYFAHLRATLIDSAGESLSFTESDHLDGDVNMIDVLRVLVAENARRDDGVAHSVPPRSRPPHARRHREDPHQSRLHRHRPPQGPGRTARRDPRAAIGGPMANDETKAPPGACDCHMHVYEPGYPLAPTAVAARAARAALRIPEGPRRASA